MEVGCGAIPVYGRPVVRCFKLVTLFATMTVLLVSGAPCAQQNPKRLILKDGSYQAATKWEI